MVKRLLDQGGEYADMAYIARFLLENNKFGKAEMGRFLGSEYVIDRIFSKFPKKRPFKLDPSCFPEKISFWESSISKSSVEVLLHYSTFLDYPCIKL